MNLRQRIQEYFFLTLGTVLVAIGVYFFKFPNNFSIGGVAGLAVLLGEVVHIPFFTPSVLNLLLNLLFLALGFLLLSRSFGLRTVYSTLLSSLLIQIFEWFSPLDAPLTDQLMLELFFAVLLPSLGSAILLNLNASSGGTDIAAMILKKYIGLDVGTSLLLCDVLIAAAALFIFDITAGLCSLLGLVLKSVLVDGAIESLNRRKAFLIVTSQPQIVCDYITNRLIRGATVWNAKGAYTQIDHHVILTVLSRGQAVLLRRYLKEHDPQAFLIITNSSEIVGKGFLHD